jgi:hypothetical protein
MADWLEKGNNLATAISLPTLPWRIIMLSSLFVAWFAVDWKPLIRSYYPRERLELFEHELCALERTISANRYILQVAGHTDRLDIAIPE